MSVRYLLDTNVFRELGKSEPHEHVGAWLAGVDDGELAVSAVTIREVWKGIERLRQHKPDLADQIGARADAVVAALGDRLLPVTGEIAQVWGAMLGRSDKHIDDTALAATARVGGLIVVTRNTRDFAGRGVDMLDPYQKRPRIVRADQK